MSGDLLPVLSLVWPLALACLAAAPGIRPRALRLLPLAPLPALWFGLLGAPGSTAAPALLLDTRLEATPAGALLFTLTAALWTAAGLYAQAYMAGTRKPAVFSGFWCLTLAGNLGVFLAADVVAFYVAFATVSLPAYVLVVHDGSDAAQRAGRVYIAMAVLGEVCLLTAFAIGIAEADSLSIRDIREALPAARLGKSAAALLIVGFGIKAGLMPLHLWLPLAHPAAPTPASAVLSGAIVKAGTVGLLLFLPPGTGFGTWLMAAGFLGGFVAALLALTQADPKAILAYSTISQMGLTTALIGGALGSGGDHSQAVFYALHHGLAKGALFLSVGLVAACGGRWRAAVLCCAAVVALSIAGAPGTGGGLVKLAAKSSLEGMPGTALTLSAITTTLALARFILRLSGASAEGRGRPAALLALPTLALGLGALMVPWLLWPAWSGLPLDYPMRPSSLWSSFWPVLVGLALFLAAGRSGIAAPSLPAGDVVAALRGSLVPRGVMRRPAAYPTAGTCIRPLGLDRVHAVLRRCGRGAFGLEEGLRRLNWGGVIAVAFIGALALLCAP